MAKFTPSQIDIDRINGGNRYQNGDYPTPETFNAPIEAAIFAQSLATNQPNVENANNIGVPSVNIEQVTDGGVRFVFSNLKGEKGQDGKDHSQEIASLNSQIYTANDKISRLTKEVSNLESQLNPDLIVFDKQIAYAKEVPIRSAPYAEITKFGGMSYKSENLFDKSKVSVTETTTGFSFTNAGSDGQPIPIGLLKDIAPSLKVGDNITFYADVINASTLGDFLYLADSASYWDEGAFHTVTESDLNGQVFAYGAPNVVCEYNNLIITKIANSSYEPYFEGLRHAKPTAFKSAPSGKNKFNPEWLLVGDGVLLDNGYYAVRMQTLYANYYTDGFPMQGFKENTQYTLSLYGYNYVKTETWVWQVHYTDGTKEDLGVLNSIGSPIKKTATTAAGKTVSKIAFTYLNADTCYIKDICVREGVDTTYIPYTESTLAIPTEVQNIDGYGLGINENVYNYIEWKPDESIKKYHKACGAVDLGTLAWDYSMGGATRFQAKIPSNAKPSMNNAVASNIICSKYTTGSADAVYAGEAGICFAETNVWVHDTNYTDVSTFKSAMQGVMLVYEIATPEVTDISDILPDDNLIAVEGGGTIIAVNEYEYAVPSEITYQLRSAT